jgi:hypothetical protein
MTKVAVSDFDQSACEGCEHRVEPGTDTGNGLIDTLAEIEAGGLSAATGEDQHKCGLCGCPLANLELFNRAPSGCPRLAEHGGEQ